MGSRRYPGIVCEQCGIERPRPEYGQYRRARGINICVHCQPTAPGRRSDRKFSADALYKCTGTCGRELPPDWFYIKTTAKGNRYVWGECRRCRAAIRNPKPDLTVEEAQLRDDVLYDYDLGRNMFGYSHDETVAWILKGYKTNLDEERLQEWGVTQRRKVLWEPDHYDPSIVFPED